jgi:hypothetical protein
MLSDAVTLPEASKAVTIAEAVTLRHTPQKLAIQCAHSAEFRLHE